MSHAILFDCEFLTAEGAPSRLWCGPYDPDPIVVQIGLVRLDLAAPFEVLETLRLHIVPLDRQGQRIALDPFFTRLTGITEAVLDRDGQSLGQALEAVSAFANGARLWSWGKDEFNMMAISCYVAGIAPILPATAFGNACDLFLAGGMDYADLKVTPSNKLAAHFGLSHPELRGHDAVDDALSVAYAVQHLLREGALLPEAFGA